MLTARNCDVRRPAAPTTFCTIAARSRISPAGFCATVVGRLAITRTSLWEFTTRARRLVPPMSMPTITSFALTIGNLRPAHDAGSVSLSQSGASEHACLGPHSLPGRQAGEELVACPEHLYWEMRLHSH